MKIIIHRGAEEQGGNCIELVSGNCRILLDYGAPPAEAKEQAALNIPGLYTGAKPPIQALLISHSHPQHYGALLGHPINPAIKVYMSELVEETIRINALVAEKSRKLGNGIQHYSRGRKFMAGRFAITPYLMDHNAAEAYAFLVEADGQKVIYTGDFRGHGCKSDAFKHFLAANTGRIDALITDGVQAGLEKGPEELEVMDHVEKDLVKKCKPGALFFMCSGQDLGQLASLASLALRTRRYLAVDGYTALLLEKAKELALKQGVDLKLPGLHTDYLRVIRSYATQRVYRLSEYKEIFSRMRDKMFGWDWVRANLDRLIIPVRAGTELWVAEEIDDLSNAAFVYSAWESYKEEPGLPETLAWFKASGLPATEIPSTGHAYFAAIRKLDENKKPRFIIPVNTTEPEKFAVTFGKRARLLKNGGELDLFTAR